MSQEEIDRFIPTKYILLRCALKHSKKYMNECSIKNARDIIKKLSTPPCQP